MIHSLFARDRQPLIVENSFNIFSDVELYKKCDKASLIRVYFDCTDLLEAIGRHSTVTGIDRVQIRLLDQLLGADEAAGTSYALIVRKPGGAFDVIAARQARQLLVAASKPCLDTALLAAIANECIRDALPLLMGPGDLYFIPGAFWTVSTADRRLSRLKENGVTLGAYVYDLIPMTEPQFCMAAHSSAFAMAFAEIMPQLDFALTISNHVAGELKQALMRYDMPVFPIIAAPLAHQFEPAIVDHGGTRTSILDDLRSRPYVLCVGTIEARKNHLYLLNIWQTLAREGLSLPRLVFLGRLGWRVSDLIEQIKAVRFLSDHVKILNDVSDADLACLYEHCLFTAFPSFVEGWGLPVGEGLARGKIVVASSASSIPEVGGAHALYVDPHNLNSGIAIVRRLLTDPVFRQSTEQEIRASFKPRTWSEASEGFLSGLEQGTQAQADRKTFAPYLEPSRFLHLADLTSPDIDLERYMRQPLRLILQSGWRPIDHGGSWILDKRSLVKFDTRLPAGTLISVMMTFVTVPWLIDSALIIQGESLDQDLDARLRVRKVLAPSCMLRHTATICVGEDGVAAMTFEIEGTPRNNPPEEMAVLWIRMLTIGWCPTGDLAARLSLLEATVWS